jgi:hypothetical protein
MPAEKVFQVSKSTAAGGSSSSMAILNISSGFVDASMLETFLRGMPGYSAILYNLRLIKLIDLHKLAPNKSSIYTRVNPLRHDPRSSARVPATFCIESPTVSMLSGPL